MGKNTLEYVFALLKVVQSDIIGFDWCSESGELCLLLPSTELMATSEFALTSLTRTLMTAMEIYLEDSGVGPLTYKPEA